MDFFKNLVSSGLINNTAIIFGADHGCRLKYFQTPAGNHEARLPLMYVILPKWFREKYPTAYNNLKFNGQHRLSSQYDIHTTLQALHNKEFSNPQSYYNPDKQYGVNLLAPVPEKRSCEDAGI